MPGRSTASLLPREHGAYAQLAVALLAGACLGPNPRGGLLATGAAAVFLASEPALVLAGRRGTALRDAEGGRARRRLLALGLVGASATLMGLWGAPLAHIFTLLPSALLGLALLVLFLRGREHTALGELVAALAFSATALPVALRAGAPAPRAAALAGLLSALHVLGTGLVRGHLGSLRKGAGPLPRNLAVALGLAAAAALLALAPPGRLRLSLVPLALAALWVGLRPPAPTQFRVLGWALATASALGAALMVVGLRA